MSDIRKEQERDELHKTIWGIADDLRGSVDGWDFKSYVLGMMFYRYISENLTNYINAGEAEAGNTDFDYAKLSDEDAEQARTDLVNTKGFFILPSELFVNVRARAARDENLNETLERVFKHIEESAKGSVSEDDFAGLFDDIDVNSNKLGATVAKRNDKLATKLGACVDCLAYCDENFLILTMGIVVLGYKHKDVVNIDFDLLDKLDFKYNIINNIFKLALLSALIPLVTEVLIPSEIVLQITLRKDLFALKFIK